MSYLLNRKGDSWNLAANVKGSQEGGESIPKYKKSQLFELKSGIKIGVIGLATI